MVLTAVMSQILLLAGPAAAAGDPAPAAIRGTATYREKVATPAGARLEVLLVDVTRTDAPAETVAQAAVPVAGQPPFQWEVRYEPARIVESHRYAVQARLTHEGRTLFTTDQTTFVITGGSPTEVKLLLKTVPPAPKPMPGSDRDEHGCIGSAGYSWCAREKACVRPWELAKEKGLEPGEEAFRAYCSSVQRD